MILTVLIPINTKAKTKRDACLFLLAFLVIVLRTRAFSGIKNYKLIWEFSFTIGRFDLVFS